MSTSTAVSAKKQIRQSLGRWRGALDDQQLPLFREFVEDTLNRIRGPFLAHHPPMEVLEYLEIAFGFARTRKSEAVKTDVREGRGGKGVLTLSSMQDQPFIVDTIRLFLRRHKADYWGGFNLVFHGKRDAEGHLIGVGESAGGQPESLVLLESDLGDLLADASSSAADMREALELARAMVTDFVPMTRTVERFAEKFETLADRQPDRADAWNETSQFLKWLLRENFVFMGMDAGSALGVQKLAGAFHGTAAGDWPPAHEPSTVQVRKSPLESVVHRAGRIDEILVTLPAEGEAQTLFIRGLFTYRAVTQPSRNVPILRGVLGSILDEQQSRPGSFRYKGIANVFDSLPTEFLFTATRQSIAEMVDLVFDAEQQQEVSFHFLKTGPDSAFCLVAMPKASYGDELRRQLESEILGTLQATYSDHGLFVGRYETVLLHYYLTGVVFPSDEAVQRMSERIRQLATPWLARLWAALAARTDEKTADRLADTYGRAFPEAWVRNTPVERAVVDIERLESLTGSRNLVADVWETADGQLTLSLYQARDVYLTAILPVLDNFGLEVIDSYPVPVQARGGRMHIDTFRLAATPELKSRLLARKDALVEAIGAVFAGEVESDRLSQLTLGSNLNWIEVDVIRGLSRYLRQLHVKLSVARMQEILLSRATTCERLIDLFNAKFDPDRDAAGRAAAIATAEEAVRAEIRKIRTHDEDLLISGLLTLITAMVRTNAWRDRLFHYLSFKFDASKIAEMGPRRPMFEIYVHHKDVEGVHLRMAKVARGGLRWSDRDDFRTEVLGLVTTQQVKNVVIVPEGAKGGFYLKRPSRDPGVRREEADRLYQTFIRGLLDVTDNSRDGKILPPPRVVRHDPDDPYLVVAADKGTAHLSDTANRLSLEYGHWLGDAFASGGSNGYDHKKVGITARGGWVLVRRHFAELGVDPYNEPFTCAGVGDLSGDVFGNGLIESKYTKLLAAFNHMHIFLDPNPDPARSYEERLRLFKAERKGTWDNYDKSLISQGGGVFERSAKSIPLSPEAQAMLGIAAAEASPDEVMRAILMMPVDLLWNGGIGTYVKASSETHADADDRSNDAIRVDGTELRCRTIGEGGNLGCTQKGRVEAALRGIRLNTDAIDNSGGVDMSDHEVNLKILLDRVVARGDMTLEARNDLLAQMTDEVAGLVMADNDAHGRQLSRDEVRSRQNVFAFGRAIGFVERVMGQSRKALRLPTDEELARRATLGQGLTRPELSVLQAWVKQYVFRELLRGDPKSLPGYDELLVTYFPKVIQETFPKDVRNHMLANEIAMTVATTRMIADAGAAFFPMVIETTGSSVPEIAAAYLKAQALTRVHEVRGALEQIRIGDAQHAMYLAWTRLDEGTAEVAGRWLSAAGKIPSDETLSAMKEAFDQVWALQPADAAAKLRTELAGLTGAGCEADVAATVLKAGFAGVALTVYSEAKRLGVPLSEMIVRHLAVARASRLQEVLDNLAKRPATGRWDPIALQILHQRFFQQLRNLVVRAPLPGPAKSVDELAPKLVAGPLAEVRSQVDDLLGAEAQPSIPTLIVLEERVASSISRLPEARA